MPFYTMHLNSDVRRPMTKVNSDVKFFAQSLDQAIDMVRDAFSDVGLEDQPIVLGATSETAGAPKFIRLLNG